MCVTFVLLGNGLMIADRAGRAGSGALFRLFLALFPHARDVRDETGGARGRVVLEYVSLRAKEAVI
jgi:hypothetical protein